MILNAVAITHFNSCVPIGINRRGRYVGCASIEGFTIIGLETADSRLRFEGGEQSMADDSNKPRIGEEIRKMEAEPLLPVEKKLIAWSLILGVVLLAVLIWTGNSSLPIGR